MNSEHDAWLHEALRHAPDAQVAPPPSVSELILREAQAKARNAAPPRPAPPASGFAAFWDWLARPQVAAGAASVMIATVAGVMWWDRPIDDDRGPPIPAATAPPPVAPSADRSAEVAAAPATAPVPAAAPERKEAPAAPPPPAPVMAPPEPAKSEFAAKRAGPEREAGTDALAQTKEKATAQPRPFPAAPVDRAPAPATTGVAADTASDKVAVKPLAPPAPPSVSPPAMMAAPAQVPAPTVTAAPATNAPTAAAPMRERLEGALAGNSATRRADLAESRSAAAAGRVADAKAADAARQTMTAELQKSAGLAGGASPPTDLAGLRRALAAEPRRWTWQRGGASPQPVNERLRNWLAQLDSAAAAGWQRVPLTLPAGEQRDAALVSAPRELRLLRDGRLVATLRLDGSLLRLENAASDGQAASARQVPLDANAVQSLDPGFP